MESWHRNRLGVGQSALVRTWLPGVRVLNDLSWGLVDTAVLEVASEDRRYVVKAGGTSNTHIGREIAAHQSAVAVWARENRAPKLIHADRAMNILVTEFLEGSLVQGTSAEYEEETYRQAGRLLGQFHAQTQHTNAHYEMEATTKALSWLDTPHRIVESAAERTRAVLNGYQPRPVSVVPTHGDWQPRNWLLARRDVKIIDFGRFDFRPAMSDFCRLAAQQWHSHPQLETAFFEGYGTDPRDSDLWNIAMLREAVSTAAWAYQAGDQEFEKQGHRMLREALVNF